MSYLLIKQSDIKTFKAFLSGNEIEVGVVLDAKSEVFGTGEEVEIFYGNDYSDTYRAQITRQKKTVHPRGEQSFVTIGLLKR